MNMIRSLEEITREYLPQVGGKCYSLAVMAKEKMRVPRALCICFEAYLAFLKATGLREKIRFELYRKDFDEMRWEEIWDASLRIRNYFIKTKLPDEIADPLAQQIDSVFGDKPVAVRSSASGEDSASYSFAGLHESYINVKGTESILYHTKLVWASLWSNRAILYRKELELDIDKSKMGVLIQEMIAGDRSGVTFSQSPDNKDQAMIEAVYGLNQGLVDGTVEPDRWNLHRRSGEIHAHSAAHRAKMMVPDADGVRMVPVPGVKSSQPPLDRAEVRKVYLLACQAENVFGSPQDVEWTLKDTQLHVLQSRPITSGMDGPSQDKRSWYLSLQRSFDSLKVLRRSVEEEILPGMENEARKLARQDLKALSDEELVLEIERRSQIYDHWVDVYWHDCIPLAHGIRLFGQIYNDTVRPEDPYEFMELLGNTNMVSLERNQRLEELAVRVQNDPELEKTLRSEKWQNLDRSFVDLLDDFLNNYLGHSLTPAAKTHQNEERRSIVMFLLEMVDHPERRRKPRECDLEVLKSTFLSFFDIERRSYAEELLDLARASYRLRDDDNMYLEKIRVQRDRPLDEGRGRILARYEYPVEDLTSHNIIGLLRDGEYEMETVAAGPTKEQSNDFELKARQIIGQPAGPGISSGKARVVLDQSNLFEFESGDVLVCDALSPDMTFVIPLAAGIVERRGGMLIHGAIIAREYGIPCITGIQDATTLIQTGDQITVDGYAGILFVGKVHS